MNLKLKTSNLKVITVYFLTETVLHFSHDANNCRISTSNSCKLTHIFKASFISCFIISVHAYWYEHREGWNLQYSLHSKCSVQCLCDHGIPPSFCLLLRAFPQTVQGLLISSVDYDYLTCHWLEMKLEKQMHHSSTKVYHFLWGLLGTKIIQHFRGVTSKSHLNAAVLCWDYCLQASKMKSFLRQKKN